MAVNFTAGKFKADNDAGAPLVGGLLYTYASGTTTPKATYTSATLGTSNTNPVVLDARGEAAVWLGSGAYTMVLKTSAGVTIWTQDGIQDNSLASTIAVDDGQSGALFTTLQSFIAYLASYGALFIGFLQAGAGAVRRTLQDKGRDTVSVKDFGAVGNGDADDTAAINAALAYLASIGGGTLEFPNGTYKTTAQITIPANCISLVGTGKRGVYPGLFVPGVNTPSTIMPVHSGRNAIRFYSSGANGDGSFMAHGLNVATLESGSMPTSAFGWDCSGVFMRDFTFEQCGIYGFTSAFDVYRPSGSMAEMGLFKAINNNINRNQWIARTLDGTQWNGFLFRDNEAGQNGYSVGQGGIAIAAHSCSIENNCMEGMRDPVKITGTYRGISVRGNYFEANVGRACVELASVRGPWSVGPNTYLALVDSNIAHKALVTDSGIGWCIDPYWSNVVHKANLPVLGADNATGDNLLNNGLSSADYGFCRVDILEGQNFSREPQFSTIAYQRATANQREINPQTGDPMPVQEYTTSGAGAVALTYTISGSSGQWVVVSWLMKQQPGSATANPYVSINVNGTNAAGSKDYVIEAFTNYWRAGEWALITCAIKLGAAMSSLSVNLFPHGTSPSTGLVSRFLRPVVYTVDDINKVIPYIDNFTAQSAASSPAAGTWKQGDWIYNSSVSSAGQSRFVCSVAGAPGTWFYG